MEDIPGAGGSMQAHDRPVRSHLQSIQQLVQAGGASVGDIVDLAPGQRGWRRDRSTCPGRGAEPRQRQQIRGGHIVDGDKIARLAAVTEDGAGCAGCSPRHTSEQ